MGALNFSNALIFLKEAQLKVKPLKSRILLIKLLNDDNGYNIDFIYRWQKTRNLQKISK